QGGRLPPTRSVRRTLHGQDPRAPQSSGTLMRSLGIDLAAEPPDTAACEITWLTDSARGRLYTDRLDDDQLLALIESADKVGIDCPFGWPKPFANAVAAHANAAAWPGRGQHGSSHPPSLRHPLTDQ